MEEQILLEVFLGIRDEGWLYCALIKSCHLSLHLTVGRSSTTNTEDVHEKN